VTEPWVHPSLLISFMVLPINLSWRLQFCFHSALPACVTGNTWHSLLVLQGTQEVSFQEEILKCVVEMEPSVAWLSKMINTRCRHWCDNDYPGWWACYFDYKTSGLRGSGCKSFGRAGDFANPSLPPLKSLLCPLCRGQLTNTRCTHESSLSFQHALAKCLGEKGIWFSCSEKAVQPPVISLKLRAVFVLFIQYSVLMFDSVNERYSKPQNILPHSILFSFV
jgi:hypothetical protein